MIINSRGYSLNFITKEPSKDDSDHLYSYVYKFLSPVTKLHYVVRADYHKGDFFGVKFYAKMYRKSDYKYSKITNKGDLSNILVTSAKVVPLLMKDYPNASFGFAGSRTIDRASKKVEGYDNNQRFRIYRHFCSLLFGRLTFEHYEYDQISGYLLVNKNNNNVCAKEQELIKMLSNTYNNLPDIGGL